MNYKANHKILIVVLFITVFLVATFSISRFIIIDNIRKDSSILGSITNKWQKISGNWYYYDSKGNKVTGWKKISGNWYYFDGSGAMASNKDISYGGETWHCASSGECTKKASSSSSSSSSKPSAISSSKSNGWIKNGGIWYYYVNGSVTTGWNTINGKKYYFESNGAMVTGFKTISGKTYYFESGGQMHVGWRQLNNVWYYFDSNGVEQTGFKQIGGVWYYFDASGIMQVNMCKTKSDGVKLCFDSEGRGTESQINDEINTENEENSNVVEKALKDTSKDGWDEQNGRWYYYKNNEAVTGWQRISGNWYYFDTKGVMSTGIHYLTYEGKKGYYYFNSKGHMQVGWQNINNKWYYFATKDFSSKKNVVYGAAITGWQTVGSYTYYFQSNGVMTTGIQYLTYNGSKNYYYFDNSGHMSNGWKQIDGKWYYFATKDFSSKKNVVYGAAITGWQTVGKYNYYFADNGVMATGLKKLEYNGSKNYYYFNTSGHLLTGWRKINKKWYYFAPNTYAKKENVIAGAALTGFKQISNKWYYFNDKGVMQTNTCKTMDNGVEMCFDKDGHGTQQSETPTEEIPIEEEETCTIYSSYKEIGQINIGKPIITVSPQNMDPKNYKYSPHGFTVAGNYYIAAIIGEPIDQSKPWITQLSVYDRSTNRLISTNTITDGSLAKVNDMAYNPNNGNVYATAIGSSLGGAGKINFATFALNSVVNGGIRSKNNIEIYKSFSPAYRPSALAISNGYLYTIYNSGSTSTITNYKINGQTLNEEGGFSTIVEVDQGITAKDDKVLALSSSVNSNNRVSIYTKSGKYLGSYRFTGDSGREIESISYTGTGNTFALYYTTNNDEYYNQGLRNGFIYLVDIDTSCK